MKDLSQKISELESELRCKETEWSKIHTDLRDRIKVLEGERVTMRDAVVRHGDTVYHLKSLLRRIPLGKLRNDDTRDLYLEVCKVTGQTPWVEK